MLFERKNPENWGDFCVLTGKIKWIHFHVCFDRKNPANWLKFLLWHESSNTFIWICVLTKEINLINNYRLLINFSYQICFLTGKIQKIELIFVFWQVKSNEFISMCFDRKNPANWLKFLLWHESSNKFIWICVLTKEINLINIYRLLIKFFPIKFAFWQIRSRKLSWILCFDR